MTCEEFLARHSEFLDHELAADVAVEMQLHMAGCERCARYDRVLRRGLSVLRESEPIQPRSDPYIALQQHLAHEETRSGARAPAVATVMAAAMLGLFAWSAMERAAPGTDPGPVVQRVSPESVGLWAGPVVRGMDLMAPAFPQPSRWPHEVTVGEAMRPGSVPVLLQRPGLDRGPYTPIVVQPPDYGQAPEPALLTSYGH